MMKLRAELVEGARFPRMLAKLTERLSNWREFWVQGFLPRYLEQVQQNFETEGELVGGWPGLSPEYAAWKARHFPGAKILERSRRLRESLRHGSSGSDTVLRVRPLQLEVGTRVPWGKYHMRRRRFLPRVLVKDWTPWLRMWMREQVKASSGG